jgi:hypothetical protein
MNKSTLSIIFLVSVFSNIEAQEKPLYTTLNDHIPQIGNEMTLYLGDQMMVQRNGQYKECFIPKTNLQVGWRGENYEFIANKPVCKKQKDNLYFYPNYILMTNCRGANETVGTCPYLLGLGKPIDLIEHESDYEIKIGHPRNNTEERVKFHKKFTISGLGKENINHQTWFLHTENSFQQTIEYAGKSGSTLKFIYSEFKDNLSRDAFTREFTIDTDEGNVGAYKGAIFEVIEATNSSIKFKVIRHFQS